MKRLITIFLLIAANLVFATEYPAELVRVTDGDTVRLKVQVWPDTTVTTNVRVAGVDTPETDYRAKCDAELRKGLAATAYTKAFMSGESRITVRNVKHGSFAGRMVGTIKVDGVDLSQVLIAAGLGRENHGQKRASWCPNGP